MTTTLSRVSDERPPEFPTFDASGAQPPPPPPLGTPPPPPPPSGLTAPPGYVAYGVGSYGAFSPFDRVRGLAKWMGILLIASAVFSVISTALSYALVGKAEDYLAGDISESDFIGSYAVIGLAGVAASGVSIALIVLTIMWMFRMVGNTRKLRGTTKWSPGWAIGGWFCPPVLYVIPYLIFRELWRLNDPDVPANDPRAPSRTVAPIVTVWWILYGIIPMLMVPLGISVAFSNLGGGSADDIAEQLRDNQSIQTVSAIVGLASTAVFFVLVKQLTARHTSLTKEA